MRFQCTAERAQVLMARLLAVLLLSLGLSATAAAQVRTAAALRIVDLAQREVTLPGPAKRIMIDDGRFLIAMGLIHPDPVSLLAAWPRDINRVGEKTYQAWRTKFPRIDSVAQVPSSAATFSLERTIAIKPDVAVLSLDQAPSAEELKILAAAGIPVVFIDFFSKPLQNLEPSLKILGQIIGRSGQTEEFLAFRHQHMNRIAEVLKQQPDRARPKVFFEAHAGMSPDCCNSPGKGNIGDYIELAGGHNIGADILPGAFGRVNVEYMVSREPDVYIATGGPHLEKANGLVLGPGYAEDRVQASLARMMQRPGISLLAAVQNKQVHGLSHQLLNSPLDILAVEALARWIHPGLFDDIDPSRTLAEINTRFLAVPLEGIYWIDLK